MDTCIHCGEEIEFRYLDGKSRPIHVSGRFCTGWSQSSPAVSAYDKLESYTDPNARCPVCQKPVFFYRSPYNGRVFFDDLGWPWPKHPCTDRYKGGDQDISSNEGIYKFNLRGKDGILREIYRVENVVAFENRLQILLLKLIKTSVARTGLWLSVDSTELNEKNITEADIHEPPSVLLARTDGTEVEIDFMSARHQAILTLKATKI